jgi:hypothetical protein
VADQRRRLIVDARAVGVRSGQQVIAQVGQR